MLTAKMAMKIGSKFSEVQARHCEQFSESVGFTKAQAKRQILELAKSLPVTARKLQSDPGHRFSGNAVVEQINTLIEQRCALTIRRLTDPVAEMTPQNHGLNHPVDAGLLRVWKLNGL